MNAKRPVLLTHRAHFSLAPADNSELKNSMLIDNDSQRLLNNNPDQRRGDLCNFGNRRNVKDAWRDARFFPLLLKARYGTVSTKGAVTSVKSDTDTLPPRFRRHLRTYDAPRESLLRRYRSPALWRDLSPWCAAFYRHVAASSLGSTHAITLNLSPEVEAKARLQPSAASWLLKRITHELRQAFPDQEPMIWFVLEETNRRRLHLHGELVTTDPEQARRALRKAAGEWEHVRQWQAHTEAEPDSGWLGYAFKLIGKYRNSRYAAARGFQGEATASTQNLSRLAKRLYELDRDAMLKAHQRPLALGSANGVSSP